MARVTALVQWFQATRAGRLNARYGAVHGAQLAGGIAYAALFSVFAGLTIAFTIFMRVLGNDLALRDAVVNAIDQALPGIIKTAANPDAPLSPDDLVMHSGLSLTTVIAAVTLLISAISVMGALGGALRAVFGLVAPPGNVVVAKLRDLGGFVLLAVAVVTTAILGVGAGVAGSWLTDLLHLDSAVGAVLVRVLGVLVALVVDAVVFVCLIRFLAGARPPRKDLWLGAAIGAVGTSVLRIAGTSLVGGATANPLLASFAAVVTLLLWVNLAARLALYVAAFTANPPQPGPPVPTSELHAAETPNFVTMSVPYTLRWDHDARTGAVQPSEADRLQREEAANERAEHTREVEAALGAALAEPEGWWAKRRRVRRARKAAREVRGENRGD